MHSFVCYSHTLLLVFKCNTNQFKALAKQSIIEGRLIGSYNDTLLFRIVNPEKSKMLIEQRCFLSVV